MCPPRQILGDAPDDLRDHSLRRTARSRCVYGHPVYAGEMSAAEHRESPPEGVSVDWDALPEPVRGRLVELAANALGDMPKNEVPPRLRAVAKFAPAKRARVAAAALFATLRESPAFRSWIGQWTKEYRPDSLDLDSGDAVAAAAASVLLGERDVDTRLRVVAEHAEVSGLRADRDAALARIERLEVELERVRAERDDAVRARSEARAEREPELERLRTRLREQGVELRKARDAARAAREDLEHAGADSEASVAEVQARLERERQRADAERARADRALADADRARQSVREARRSDEVRLELLLDTVERAAAGLRSELAVGRSPRSSGTLPADSVVGASSAAGGSASATDPAGLDRLLALPNNHLIVDGYNVTKSGYPDLPLADQRDRLARQLSSLAARTSSEVTVVFDGAGVIAVPTATFPGLRVLFSDPGVLADDVIRALVHAEPDGRPLIVATSDREVVDSVRRRGAHTVSSAVLLARLVRV